MTTTTRRTILAGAAALPLLPAAALAASVTLPLLPVAAFAMPGNATDTAWSAYEAAKAAFAATDRDYDAMEASLPEHLKLKVMPKWTEYSPDEWPKRVDAWNRSRAELGAEAVGEALEQAAGLVNDAEAVVLEMPGTTLTDIERKLSILHGFGGDARLRIFHRRRSAPPLRGRRLRPGRDDPTGCCAGRSSRGERVWRWSGIPMRTCISCPPTWFGRVSLGRLFGVAADIAACPNLTDLQG